MGGRGWFSDDRASFLSGGGGGHPICFSVKGVPHGGSLVLMGDFQSFLKLFYLFESFILILAPYMATIY